MKENLDKEFGSYLRFCESVFIIETCCLSDFYL